jgi:hypothetical protein
MCRLKNEQFFSKLKWFTQLSKKRKLFLQRNNKWIFFYLFFGSREEAPSTPNNHSVHLEHPSLKASLCFQFVSVPSIFIC